MLRQDEAQAIMATMKETSLRDLRLGLLKAAIEYATVRAQTLVCGDQDRAVLEDRRTQSQYVFIDACNILSRNQGRGG